MSVPAVESAWVLFDSGDECVFYGVVRAAGDTEMMMGYRHEKHRLLILKQPHLHISDASSLIR